jgi:hypothetical protein
MSHENVEAVRRQIEAWNRRELTTWLATFPPTRKLTGRVPEVRPRLSIAVVASRSTFVYTVENGQITRLRMFQERGEALEAAGLSE